MLYGALLVERFARRYEQFVSWIEPYHRVLGSTSTGRIGPDNPRAGFVGDDRGLYYHPALVADVRPTDKLSPRRRSGPSRARRLDDAVDLAKTPGYGLSSSIYTTNPTSAFQFREGVGTGVVSVNSSTADAEAHLPVRR